MDFSNAGSCPPDWLEMITMLSSTQTEIIETFKKLVKIQEPVTSLSDVVGLIEVKQELLKIFRISNTATLPKNLSENKILLFGPYGCGKSSLVHGLAKAFNANLIILQPSWIQGCVERMEESVKFLTQFVLLENKVQPTIMFFPRLTCYYFSYQEASNVNKFIQNITSVWERYCVTSKLIVIATMSEPKSKEDEDVKFFESFQTRMYVPPLSFPERKDLIMQLVRKIFGFELALKDEELEDIARKTKLTVTVEIVNLVKKAVHVQYDQGDIDMETDGTTSVTLEKRAVTKADFDFAVNRGFLTLTQDQVDEFEACHAMYGNGPFVNFIVREQDEKPGCSGGANNKGTQISLPLETTIMSSDENESE